MTKSQKKLWIGLLILSLLTPLGIILPEKFKAGGAWGEWGPEELEKLIGYVPKGLKRLADLWKAPVPDYNFGGEGASTDCSGTIIPGFRTNRDPGGRSCYLFDFKGHRQE